MKETNVQGTKKILFNRSTLLSLKAELLKKQEEVHEKKQLPENKLENFKPPLAQKPEKHDRPERKSFKDSLKEIDTEELEACRKSKSALEKKAVLYEHLADGVGTSQLSEHFLVDFNLKKQQEPPQQPVLEVAPDDNDVQPQDDESEWAEYTDCLGRTRKCLKTDLELYKKRDQELMKSMKKYEENDEGDQPDDAAPQEVEKPLLVQTTNAYLQSLRDKWEQKEQELLAKDKDVHYQDLLFDEARIHGVGYYSFSTDETERRKQMAELIRSRDETLKAQQDAERRRSKRDELIEARVAAARARRRARAGLPPEDPNEKQKDFTACLLEFLTQQKNEADAKAKEEDKKIREEKEKERQKLRETFVREWDVGKTVGDDDKKKFKIMSQEEYVDQERSRRIDEFAPPRSRKERKSQSSFDNRGKVVVDGGETSKSRSWADVRPEIDINPEYTEEVNTKKGLYFSSKKLERDPLYTSFVRPQEPVLIFNEIGEGNNDRPEKRKMEGNVEVAPPPTYDYYGPASKHSKADKPFHSDMREAYEQGVRELEAKGGNIKLPAEYDFTF